MSQGFISFFGQRVAFVALAIVAMTGCSKSDPAGTVKGNVTLGGKPYTDAAVIFLSLKSGQGDTADIDSEGKYEVGPLPLGNYKIYLAPKVDEKTMAEAKPVSIDTSVASKYWNEASTELSYDVKEGEQEYTIELTSK